MGLPVAARTSYITGVRSAVLAFPNGRFHCTAECSLSSLCLARHNVVHRRSLVLFVLHRFIADGKRGLLRLVASFRLRYTMSSDT